MEEKNKIKIGFGTVISIVIIVLLIIALFGMWYYYNYINKSEVNTNQINTQNSNTNNKENAVSQSNYIQQITLSESDKIKINQELNNSFEKSLREITNFEYEDIIYNNNLLNSMKNKYYVVLYAMLMDETMKEHITRDLNEEGIEETGAVAIKKTAFENYYYNIFNEKLNEQELLKINMLGEKVSINNDTIYGYIVTGSGQAPFLLKANKLEFDKNNNTYILYVNFLASVLNENGYREIKAEDLEQYSQSTVLTWNNSLNYATLKINYKKDNSQNYVVNSVEFTNK